MLKVIVDSDQLQQLQEMADLFGCVRQETAPLNGDRYEISFDGGDLSALYSNCITLDAEAWFE